MIREKIWTYGAIGLVVIIFLAFVIGALVVLGYLFLGPVIRKIKAAGEGHRKATEQMQMEKEALEKQAQEKLSEEYGAFAWYYKQESDSDEKGK